MPKRPSLFLGLLLLAGCVAPVRQNVDALLCERVGQPVDLALPQVPPRPPEPEPEARKAGELGELPPPRPVGKGGVTLEQRLEVPRDVPGSEAPPIVLPAPKELTPKMREALRRKHFPPLPPVGPDPAAAPGPHGQPLTLADLQKMARANSPILRQAAADVEAARGAALQAGLYPNPLLGTQNQSNGPGGGPFWGLYVSQTIKTMGKLKLAQAAAAQDLVSAQLAFRKAEADVAQAVRAAYFAAAVARESMRAGRALVRWTDEAYEVMALQFQAGEVAAYEPTQVGALAAQSRTGLVQARNNYLLAWKQLASALGLPAMPPTELTLPTVFPRYDYEKALAHVVSYHTDVLTARAGIEKARYNLRLAEVTAVPDVNVQALVQQDASPPGPSRVFATINASVPVPLFDRNQGGIRQAQGNLLRANEEPHRVRAELTARFTEVFRRYTENRTLSELYRGQVLPKQVQAFRAAVKRHAGGDPGRMSFLDLINAEQILVANVGTYYMLLAAQWQAAADLTGLLQTDDIAALAEKQEACPVPDLSQLLTLPCCHPSAAGSPSQHAAPPPAVVMPPASVAAPPAYLPADPTAAPAPRPALSLVPRK